MGKEFCDQCNNHCPVDSLGCNRGRKAFGMELDEEREHHHHGKGHPEGVIGLLMQCGHRLHHGTVEADELLSKLTVEEQKVLEGLLTKLLS
ncbi:MAG: hypothetical protein HDR17_03410 [Lachnospiraceae bacterium]|nr:hypothetical protein [Lachnospiraceae bacterium]